MLAIMLAAMFGMPADREDHRQSAGIQIFAADAHRDDAADRRRVSRRRRRRVSRRAAASESPSRSLSPSPRPAISRCSPDASIRTSSRAWRRRRAARPIAFLQAQPKPFRIAPFFDYLWPNSSELYRLEDVRSHFSSEGSYRRLLERIDPSAALTTSTVINFNSLKFDFDDPLVSMLGVRYFSSSGRSTS